MYRETEEHMNHKDKMLMTPFDQLTSSRELQMLKLLLPFTPPESQKFFAFFIRFEELRKTMDYFQSFGRKRHSSFHRANDVSVTEMFDEIRPFLDEKDAETFDKMIQTFHMMELFRTFQEMNPDPSDPMSSLKGMLSPEQQAMFDMYSNLFDEEEDDAKGDDTHE